MRLSIDERKFLLLAELYRRSNGRSPTWAELRRGLGLDRGRFAFLALSLRERGLVAFSDEARSLKTTVDGVAAALGRPKRRAA